METVTCELCGEAAQRLLRTLRPAMATTDSVSAKGVRCSSLTNWLSWEWVRLQKKICLFLGATSSSSSSVSEYSLLLSSILSSHHTKY